MPLPTSPPSMKILALGMPRTGTLSMKQALEHLGYAPVYHGLDIFDRPKDSVIWNQLLRKKHYNRQKLSLADLKLLFAGYAAVTDMSFYLWDDLLDAYPDAKLILVQRPPDAWYPSYSRALISKQFTWTTTLFKYLVEPLLGTKLVEMGEMMVLSFFSAESKDQFHRNARDKYREYYRDVRAAAKARDRPILECDLGSGWKPLCEFLGAEVPDVAFPRANEEQEILEFWNQQQARLLKWFGKVMLCYLIPLLILTVGVAIVFTRL